MTLSRTEVRRKRNALGIELTLLDYRKQLGETVTDADYEAISKEYLELSKMKGQRLDLSQPGNYERRTPLDKSGLTVIVYHMLKDLGVSDLDIKEKFNLSANVFGKFKRENNIKRDKQVKPKKKSLEEKTRSIPKEYRERAAANGIPYRTLTNRFYTLRWDLERAVTQPSGRQSGKGAI